MIYNGDCVDILKTLLDDSVDALVTDPPAGISFMGKDWDHHKGGRKEWCSWMESVMRECFRVLKPGAHGLVWALPRTAHWTATALEDAGFEIRDCITHLFGQGFPKSLNISKAIDKAAGARGNDSTGFNAAGTQSGLPSNGGSKFRSDHPEYIKPQGITDAAKQWDGWGTALKPAAEFWWLVRKKPDISPEWLSRAQSVPSNSRPTHAELSAVMEKLAQLSATIKHADAETENLALLGRAVSGSEKMDTLLSALREADTDLSTAWSWNNTLGADLNVAKTCITLMELRQTIESRISNYLQSQSTRADMNLVPNAANIWLVRKPCSEKTVAENVLKWGTGGINIDGCRIGSETRTNRGMSSLGTMHDDAWKPKEVSATVQGRFPANLLFSHSPNCTEDACDMFECAVEMLDEQSGDRKSGGSIRSPESSTRFKNTHSKSGEQPDWDGYKDSGGASRFFYCAKISPSERNAGLEGMPDKELATSTGQTRPNAPARLGANPDGVQIAKNNHPTVKPQKLMRYLCKLVTPPGGTVLDPFMGSGSTGLAAKSEGFEFIGIEREPEYFEISKTRIG